MSIRIFFGLGIFFIVNNKSVLSNESAELTLSFYSVLKTSDSIIPLDPAVRHGKLANGFTYYIRKNGNPAKTVQMNLVVNAGSFHEDPDQLELAHLLEHMAFNGAKHFPANSLKEFFDRNGLRTGLDWNASTSTVTNYHLVLPANKPALIDTVYLILRDYAQGIILDSQATNDERGVILGEIRRGGGDNASLMYKEIEARVTQNPKYGVNVTGLRSNNVEHFKYSSLKRFYTDWYRPDLEAIIIVGDVNIEQTVEKIKSIFSDLVRPAQPREPGEIGKAWKVNLTGKNNLIILTNSETRELRLRIYMKHKRTYGTNLNAEVVNDNDIVYKIKMKIADHLTSERFSGLTQEYNYPVSNIFSSYNLFPGPPSGINILSTVAQVNKPVSVKPAFELILKELNRIKENGFSKTEFDRAKLIVSKEMNHQESWSSGEIVTRLVNHFSDGASAPDQKYLQNLEQQLLKDITVEAVNKQIASWISDKDIDFIIESPKQYTSQLPKPSEVAKWVETMRNNRVTPYKTPSSVPDHLLNTQEVDNLKGTIKSQNKNTKDEITELKLGNGMRILIKPFKDSGESIASGSFSRNVGIEGFAKGGIYAYKSEEYFLAANVCGIVKNAGVGKFNKFQLEQILNAKMPGNYNLAPRPNLTENQSEVIGDCNVRDVEMMLQLIYLHFTAPRIDSIAFKDWKARTLNELENSAPGFSTEFMAIESRNFSEQTKTQYSLTKNNVDSIKLEDIYRIYHDNFSDPAGFTFIVSGQFNDSTLIPLLVKYLGSIPSKSKTIEAGDKLKAIDKHQMVYYAGADNKTLVTLSVDGYYQFNARNNIILDFLGSALNLRIFDRIREKESGSYMPEGNVMYQKNPLDTYRFSIYFDCAPDKTQYLVEAALDEFQQLRHSGIDEDTFHKLLQIQQEGLKKRMKSNDAWSDYIKEIYIYNQSVDSPESYVGELNNITVKDINDFIKKYLNDLTLYQAVWMPAKYQHKIKKL